VSLIAIDDDEARDRGGGDRNEADVAEDAAEERGKRRNGFYFLYVYTYVKKNGTLRSHTRTLYRDIWLHVHIYTYTYATHKKTNTFIREDFFQIHHATLGYICDIP